MIKVIFAENGVGKTKECERLSVAENVIISKQINKNDFDLKFIKTSKNNITEIARNDSDFSVEIKSKKQELPFLTSEDIKSLNAAISFIGIKIENKSKNQGLNEIIIKRGNSKYSLNNSLPASSGEESFIKTLIFMLAYKNLGEHFVFDDPIEYSSYLIEIKFIEFIKKYLLDEEITIYTHNFSLFKLFTRINKNKRTLLFWIDSNKFKIDNFRYDIDNHYIQRIFFEIARNITDQYKRFPDFLEFLNITEKKYDKNDFNYGNVSDYKLSYKSYISKKIQLCHNLREALLLNSPKKLKDLERKNIRDEEAYEELIFLLNQSLHHEQKLEWSEETFLIIETFSIQYLYSLSVKSLKQNNKAIKAAISQINEVSNELNNS